VGHGHSSFDLRKRAVLAIESGQTIESIARSFGYDRATIHRWLQKYRKKKNLEVLQPIRRSGRPKKWSKRCLRLVMRDVLQPASKFGFESDFWTCRRLIQHLRKRLGKRVSQPTMWRAMREAELTYQKPEKRYKEADPDVQKKWLRDELPEIKRIARRFNAILFFEDEASIQLAPVLGKTWAPKGKTPLQVVTGNRGSIAAISAISIDGRLVFNLHRGRFRSAEIIGFLRQLLHHHPRRHLVVVLDRATPHVSKMTKKYVASQKRLHVFYLPSRSPEMNPDEKVWNYLKHQALKSHQATNLKQLESLTKRKLRKMSGNRSLIRGIFFRSSIAKLMN